MILQRLANQVVNKDADFGLYRLKSPRRIL